MIKRMIRTMVRWAATNEVETVEKYQHNSLGMAQGTVPYDRSSLENSGKGFNFTIYNADGGKVVQVLSHDLTKDRSNSRLYIIGDNDSLGQELELIITKECLSR